MQDQDISFDVGVEFEEDAEQNTPFLCVILRRGFAPPANIWPSWQVAPARECLGTLLGLLSDDRYSGRSTVLDLLGQLGPAAREAVPAIRRVLDSGNQELRQVAAEALKRIEAE
jgi:hypothetical protein